MKEGNRRLDGEEERETEREALIVVISVRAALLEANPLFLATDGFN